MASRLRRLVCAAVAVVLMLVANGCSSPGTAYGYLDVKPSVFISATPAQPAINQGFSLNFSIRNTYNQALSSITYRVLAVPSAAAPTVGTQIGTDVTVAIPAFGTLLQTVVIPAETVAGTYSYAVWVDPVNTIAERDETNNAAVITLTVADLDIAFGSPDASVDTPPVSPGPLTLHFVISNTANIAGTSPSSNVTYVITMDGNPTPIGTLTATPASPATVPTGTDVPVTVTVPRPSPGTHTYTITLSSSVSESSTTNNTAVATVPVAN